MISAHPHREICSHPCLHLLKKDSPSGHSYYYGNKGWSQVKLWRRSILGGPDKHLQDFHHGDRRLGVKPKVNDELF